MVSEVKALAKLFWLFLFIRLHVLQTWYAILNILK